jgi:hypothetical protein
LTAAGIAGGDARLVRVVFAMEVIAPDQAKLVAQSQQAKPDGTNLAIGIGAMEDRHEGLLTGVPV